MKVFVLEGLFKYEGGYIEGVFTTKQVAEAKRDSLEKLRLYDYWDIIECVVEGE